MAPNIVSLQEAEREAAARAARTITVLAPLWRAARAWTAAIVLALFPFLFIVDRVVETRLSPVLPGLAVLLLLILALPFLLIELANRRYRRKDPAWQERHALQATNRGRTAVIVAAVWVGLWFAVGT